MIKPLAPRTSRGWLWVWLLSATTLGAPAAVVAQSPPAPAPAKGEADDDKAKVEKKAEIKVTPAKRSNVEIIKDPKAEELVALDKVKNTGWRDCTQQDINAVKAMAAGQASVDRDLIQKFVQGMGYRLTDKAAIEAWLNEEKSARKSRDIQSAAENLLDVLNTAKAGQNAAFRKTYSEVLVANFPKLLTNHLLPRTEAIIILAQTGSPDAFPIFIDQLKNKEQTVWVKIWSAQGLSNIAGGGVLVDSTLGAARAIEAGKAVADFLSTNQDTPWPVTWRGLEALGAMRQASTLNNQKAEMATVALTYLTDPDANSRVRATAAWSLGMMRVSPNIPKYNAALVAYEIGQLSAEFGDLANDSIATRKPPAKAAPAGAAPAKAKTAKEKEKEKEKGKEKEPEEEPIVENAILAELYAGLLVRDLYQAFNGTEQIRESGLVRLPAGVAGTTGNFIRQIADLESSVARAAVELVRATPGNVNDRKKDLSDRVASLKTFLAKNPPKDLHLVPGGPEFKAPQVAAVPAEKAKVAGAAGGR